MHQPLVLVVDDDLSIIKLLRANLLARKYRVLTAGDGAAAIEVIERETPDLILLDIMMPSMDGFEVCRRLREWSRIPIIMLSARGDIHDKVRCLNLGADDYITKPFSVDELLARIRSVLRRSEAITERENQPSFNSGELNINFATRRVALAGQELRLTSTEYSLLRELALNSGKIFNHSELLKRVWGEEYGQEREYLRVFIGRLRTKIEDDSSKPKYIVTVPGVGYYFQQE